MSRTRIGRLVFAATTALATGLAANNAAAQPAPAGFTVGKPAGTVGFTVYAQMLFKLKREGTFHDFNGSIDFDPAHPANTHVDLTVYTASVDTKHADENEMLRSTDFFDVAEFPTMHFVSTGATVRPDGQLQVAGDLTIRGITRSIVVPVNVRNGDALETSFQIDRAEFGLIGSAKYSGFNVSIGRNVQIRISMRVTPPVRP